MSDFGKRDDERQENELFSKPVKAGKRTYFFDVKATRDGDQYLTITESKRKVDKDGHFSYEKHKIFLYKEDFEKFLDGMHEALDFIAANAPARPAAAEQPQETSDFSNVNFDDLGEK